MGTVLFVGVFGVVVQTAVQTGHREAEKQVEQTSADAARVASTLLGMPGEGWYSADASCKAGTKDASKLSPDGVKRVGLASDPCGDKQPENVYNLSYEKVNNLQGAAKAAVSNNGFVDYQEARKSLGLDKGNKDFHVRSWPVLPETREMLKAGTKDPNQKAAYVGHYKTIFQNNVVTYQIQQACGKTDGVLDAGLLYLEVWIDITNNGTSASSFEISFTVPLKDHTIEIVKHTPIIPPLYVEDPITHLFTVRLDAGVAKTHVVARLPKTADWQWAGTPEVTIKVNDSVRLLNTCKVSLADVSMTALVANKMLYVHAEQPAAKLKSGKATVKVYYDAFDGSGKRVAYSDWKILLQSSQGVLLESRTNLKDGKTGGYESFTLASADAYPTKLTTLLGLESSSDAVNVVSTTSSFSPNGVSITVYDPDDSVVPEITYLNKLLSGFQPNVYAPAYTSGEVPYAAGGDVFPDFKDAMNNDLHKYLIDDKGTQSSSDDVPTLANYNLLVVGSNVDHNAMTSDAAKRAIKDWVYAGGFLVVLGSNNQNVQWLQPIFHASLDSASGGLTSQDPSHPILKTPNKLDYLSYSNHNTAWSYTRQSDKDKFTHVLTSGAEDILGVSNSGAFGLGRVILTSWQPFDVQGLGASGPCDPSNVQPECQALQALHNFLTMRYRELYLDYGEQIPSDQEVGVVTRLASIWHPELQESVELVVQVYVF